MQTLADFVGQSQGPCRKGRCPRQHRRRVLTGAIERPALPDSRQFIHLYTDEGSKSGVQGLASFQAFIAGAKEIHDQPATLTRPELIGDHRTFDE